MYYFKQQTLQLKQLNDDMIIKLLYLKKLVGLKLYFTTKRGREISGRDNNVRDRPSPR